jgi:hypothetical protein
MCLDLIEIWHQRARPNPTATNLGVQLGCHAEEFVEMLQTLEPTIAVTDAIKAVNHLAGLWKDGTHFPMITDRKEFLDSLADQIVTAVGVGHCANMRTVEACRRVNTSNWSKYDSDGHPIFKPNGKIDKGPNYAEPDLEGLY